MNKLIMVCFLFIASNFLQTSEEAIKSNLKNILPPNSEIESIEPSNLEGLYKVYYGDLQPIYVSKDGEYFIYGDMYKISGNKVLNITNNEIKSRRLNIIDKMAKDEFIEFRSNNEKYVLTVFTDVDCGYCRKLHNEMSEYNELGISIRYAAFPRSGIGTQAFTKMVGAWCSSDPKKSITDLKKDKKLNVSFCEDQPVSKHYVIGQSLGVTGTPSMFTQDGEIFPGYVSPKELLERLKG